MTLQPIALDKETAAEFVALSVSSLERLVREGSFPKPRQVSLRRVVFLVKELESWMENCPVSELLCPPNTGAKKSNPE
tara:strand:- start:1726 stop:1959 length:234 start_codon:yes stop_codon:yes gene_type:complete